MAWFSLSYSGEVNQEMENSIDQESPAADPRQDFGRRSKKQSNAELAELHEALREKEKLLQANEIARQEMASSQQTELRDLKSQLMRKMSSCSAGKPNCTRSSFAWKISRSK